MTRGVAGQGDCESSASLCRNNGNAAAHRRSPTALMLQRNDSPNYDWRDWPTGAASLADEQRDASLRYRSGDWYTSPKRVGVWWGTSPVRVGVQLKINCPVEGTRKIICAMVV